MKAKHISSILGSALIIGSSASANLIINGDFETGISGVGYAGAGYSNEVGRFLPEVPDNPQYAFVNKSDWVIENPSATANSALAGFTDIATPVEGWGIKLGNYTDSTITYDVTLSLDSSNYVFSAEHWGSKKDGSKFVAKLENLGTGPDITIGTFTDTTPGIQNSAELFTVQTPGDYKLVLSSAGENINNAWLDNISINLMP
ncbi:MAG: hypothetical protein ACJAT5_001038 [Lentimonas sp.]|jgi:hypothetical protein